MGHTVFSLEDKDITKRPVTSSSPAENSDLDLSFSVSPKGNLYKKTSVASVKQSIRKLLLTNRGDIPFQPLLGADLNNILFELSTEVEANDIKTLCEETIRMYEPRVGDLEVFVDMEADANAVTIYIVFQIIENLRVETMEVSIARVR
jgi:phage baseplate assembly protein W